VLEPAGSPAPTHEVTTMADASRQRDDKLDEALEESFPASDPPANTVHTGVLVEKPDTQADEVTDNREASRLELPKDGDVAYLKYERRGGTLVLVHTEVPATLRGHHLGDRLVKAALDAARAERLRVVAVCPFVRAYLRRHPESTTTNR